MDLKLCALCSMVLIALFITSSNGSVIPLEERRIESMEPSEHFNFDAPVSEHHSRQKRATCDLASGFGVGHSLCAAHCIGRGFRGGYCSDKAVCTCRR